MKKELIFLDIDDTLLETQKIQKLFLNRKHNFNSSEELDSYFDKIELEELFEIGKQMLNHKNIDYLFHRTSNAYENIKDLTSEYRFECCTSRPLFHSYFIDKIIFDYYDSCIDKIHYFGELSSKVKFSEEKGARLLVDDSIKSFEGMKNSRLKGILYNSKSNGDHEGLVKMSNWNEFPKILETILF